MRRFEHVVDNQPAPEPAPQERGVHDHLIAWQVERQRDRLARDTGHLRRRPDLAPIALDVRRAVLRFHRGMRQMRHLVDRFQVVARRLGEDRFGVAVVADGLPRLRRQPPQLLGHRRRVERRTATLPRDGHIVHRRPGLPVPIGHHRHAARNLDDRRDPGTLLGGAGVERRNHRSGHRRSDDRGVEQTGQRDVDAVDRRPIDLHRSVDAVERPADDRMLLDRLQRRVRDGLLGGQPRQRAVGPATVARRVSNRPGHGHALHQRHAPRVGGGGAEHLAGHRSRLTQPLPRRAHARTAAGGLYLELRMVVAAVRHRELDLDHRRVHFELFGNQHRMGGHGALPHLDPVEDEDDAVVRVDLEPGVRLEHTGRVGGRPDRPLATRPADDRPDDDADGENPGAGGRRLQKPASCHPAAFRRGGRGLRHHRVSRISAAARCIARLIR